jgi:myo-inositol-1-phosphate synthase
MQMKINFLCQDSILAAPLVFDLVRICEVAKQKGEKGIQRQLSVYFKSPYFADKEQPQHDVFIQERMLLDWAKKVAKA